MTRAVLQALAAHWRRNPLQFFTFLAGLALATALWSGVQAINAEARASYDAAAATLGEGRFDQLVPRAGDSFPQDTYVTLRRAGWQVSPVVEGSLRTDTGRVRIVGLDPLTTPGALSPVGGARDIDLNSFLTVGVLFADAATADRLAGLPQEVVRDPSVAPDTALTDVGVAQRLLDRQGRLSRLIVAPDQPLGLPPLDEVAPGLTRVAAQSGSDVGQLTGSFHLNLTAFGLLSFAVGIFIVHGTIGLVFEQRRGMVRTLRTLGVPLRRLIVLMTVELLLLSLLAGGIGVVLGYFVAALLLPDVAATLEGLYGAQVSGGLQLRPVWWLSGLAIAVLGAGMAGAGSLWRIARMPILASARPRAWAMAAGRGRWLQGGAAVLLLAVAAGIALADAGLIATFALLGCLLIGGALALPLILGAVLALGQSRAKGVIGGWFWADTRQQLPGLSLALMALLLAMAANLGVSTMVSSFRLTFIDFLDQRLFADTYVRGIDSERMAGIQAFLQERGATVLPLLRVDSRLAGVPAELMGARIGPAYEDNWVFVDARPDAWAQVAAGEAVIVNEQLARRAGLWLDDRLDLGGGLRLPVAGVYGDYGNPLGQAVISEARFAGVFPDETPRQFGVLGLDPEDLRSVLGDAFDLPPGSVVDQSSVKAFSLAVFERTFTVTAALNVLTLAVAGFAILMSLLTLSAIRLPQLAPVWAMGLTRGTLARVELIRALVLAALTALLALPLGLALAWVLLAMVNVQAFGWRLPMYLFPLDYARLGLLTLLAAALAALWPALRMARTPVSQLLRVFANER
ncbi:putative ABC transport system permease protein [Mameliella alba]|uniref:ABC transporter permease n=1 Tax=Mameliella alba TaxID=561184 RepID=UPI000882892C|nr:ABC transporter permease [Mameliella alba]OWV48353.1 ABC transporter permease [Mameliella alba]PTR40401.1 putative ABC transport system permease protein [Mameliella alba]GGF44674.1 ABC transporter permease [Mameliella alba]SDD01781.1 putative ABC transport system permease protein [Mameliella alba]